VKIGETSLVIPVLSGWITGLACRKLNPKTGRTSCICEMKYSMSAIPDRWKAAHPQPVREYREQERSDKADTAVIQAARRRVRTELRKGK